MGEEKGREIARMLSEGRWTHDYPITVTEAQKIGLPVRTGIPEEIYELMALYPQAHQRRPSVEYVPVPFHPGGGEREPARTSRRN